MCDVLIPALIGVAALGLLSGGGGGGNETITIPQLAGEGTNVVQVSAQSADYGYAAPYYPAPQANIQAGPSYYAPQANMQAGPSYYAPGPNTGMNAGHYGQAYAAPAPYQNNIGASVDYNGQSAVGAGAYSNPYGSGVGANVGGLDAGIGVGNGGFGANVGDVGVGLGAQSY